VKNAYSFPLENFINRQKFERIKEFSRDKETPFLIIDLDIIKRIEDLRAYLPWATIYYAVKANPDDAVILCLEI